MNNGDYYTQVDRGDNGSKLNKYSYRTGKRISTIADSEKLGIAIGDYTFSEMNKKCFLPPKQKAFTATAAALYFMCMTSAAVSSQSY